MNKIIETLYREWRETQNGTPEYDLVSDVFCESNENITLDQANANHEIITECIFAESKQAFNAGFQTAVQLLMGGMQP
ncbi:MAG: hypothetical protein K2J71_00580 [Oscillospiraceae bacterium]|nr:hypothetical protein [Oscillospiraceae bacterium]